MPVCAVPCCHARRMSYFWEEDLRGDDGCRISGFADPLCTHLCQLFVSTQESSAAVCSLNPVGAPCFSNGHPLLIGTVLYNKQLNVYYRSIRIPNLVETNAYRYIYRECIETSTFVYESTT